MTITWYEIALGIAVGLLARDLALWLWSVIYRLFFS